MQIADADVARAAHLFADPSRAAMVTLLMDGRAHPATALARAAGIGRPAASSHLRQLVEAGVVEVVAQGRHRYHRITRPEVAQALEALATIAPPVPVRSLRQSTAARRLAAARTCYDHLAGRAGVVLHRALLDHGIIAGTPYAVTGPGRERLTALGLDVDAVARRRRSLARDCLDWTERTPHLAGALAAALLVAVTERGWAIRRDGRRVDVPDAGWRSLQAWLGCPPTCHPLTTPASETPGHRLGAPA